MVENKAGAGGMIGLQEAAEARNEGYDMVMGQVDNMVIAPAVQRTGIVDPVKDLTPGDPGRELAVPVHGGDRLQVQHARRLGVRGEGNPGKLTYGTAGYGTFTHLAVELLQNAGNFKAVQVPYKGASPAITDLLGGPHSDGGAVDRLRHAAHPGRQGERPRGDVGCAQSRAAGRADGRGVGFPGFEANGWLGIFVPNGTPPAVIAKLNAEIGKVMQSAEMKKQLLAQGVEARTSTPEQLGAMIKSETAKWGKIITDAGIKE